MYQQNKMVATMNNRDKQIVIISGISGAGKASVMRALEDQGFYCVDNLPIPLLTTFLTLAFQTQSNLLKVALGIDARGEQFFHDFVSEIKKLKQGPLKTQIKVIFLNASNATLLKRFQETRRKHPLATNVVDLASAIEKEKNLLEPVMGLADMILDTDTFNIHDLRHWVRKAFDIIQVKELIVNLVSFGFKYGTQDESNLIFDLRFLPNPFFVPHLKPLDGRDPQVQDYLFTQPIVVEYWHKLTDFLHYSLLKFYEEGRFFVTVAIGCTGGKHRSIAFVEKIAHEKWPSIKFIVHHRDIEKE